MTYEEYLKESAQKTGIEYQVVHDISNKPELTVIIKVFSKLLNFTYMQSEIYNKNSEKGKHWVWHAYIIYRSGRRPL